MVIPLCFAQICVFLLLFFLSFSFFSSKDLAVTDCKLGFCLTSLSLSIKDRTISQFPPSLSLNLSLCLSLSSSLCVCLSVCRCLSLSVSLTARHPPHPPQYFSQLSSDMNSGKHFLYVFSNRLIHDGCLGKEKHRGAA